MSFWVVFNQMAVLFLLMITGIVCIKTNLADGEFQARLSSFIVNVTQPLVMIASVSGGEFKGDVNSILTVFFVAIGMFVLLPFIGMGINKLIGTPKEEKNMYLFMTIFSNVGFMGYPVIQAIFGNGALFYVSIIVLVFNVMNYTVGVALMSDTKFKFDLKMIINPGMVASFLAILIYFLKIPVHPTIGSFASMLGNTTSPLAMVVIGMALSKIPLKSLFSDKRILYFTFIKQIILPVVTYFILKNFIHDRFILGILIVIIAMPIAAISVIFATKYKKDLELATRGVFVTTVLSMITIPLISMLLV
ncbi:MAG: AEC family transporter [Clostridiaceae bacterium]